MVTLNSRGEGFNFMCVDVNGAGCAEHRSWSQLPGVNPSCATGASGFTSLGLRFPGCKLLESSSLGGCKDN